MKTIGLIGGMSWESSIEYYRIINETAKAKLGGLHSAKSMMYSVDFAEIEILQHQGKWGEAAQMLIDAAKNLENSGADFIVLCTNTMHKVADDIQANVKIPFLHIADATACNAVRSHGNRRRDGHRGALAEPVGDSRRIAAVDRSRQCGVWSWCLG